MGSLRILGSWRGLLGDLGILLGRVRVLVWPFGVRSARWQGVLFRPRWLQEGLRCSKMASKMAQDSARSLKMTSIMHPRGLKTAPRRFQVPSEPSKDPSKRPKSFKNLRKINVFGLLTFSLLIGF